MFRTSLMILTFAVVSVEAHVLLSRGRALSGLEKFQEGLRGIVEQELAKNTPAEESEGVQSFKAMLKQKIEQDIQTLNEQPNQSSLQDAKDQVLKSVDEQLENAPLEQAEKDSLQGFREALRQRIEEGLSQGQFDEPAVDNKMIDQGLPLPENKDAPRDVQEAITQPAEKGPIKGVKLYDHNGAYMAKSKDGFFRVDISAAKGLDPKKVWAEIDRLISLKRNGKLPRQFFPELIPEELTKDHVLAKVLQPGLPLSHASVLADIKKNPKNFLNTFFSAVASAHKHGIRVCANDPDTIFYDFDNKFIYFMDVSTYVPVENGETCDPYPRNPAAGLKQVKPKSKSWADGVEFDTRMAASIALEALALANGKSVAEIDAIIFSSTPVDQKIAKTQELFGKALDKKVIDYIAKVARWVPGVNDSIGTIMTGFSDLYVYTPFKY